MELVVESILVFGFCALCFATAHWVCEQSKLCADPEMFLDIPVYPKWKRKTKEWESEWKYDELKLVNTLGGGNFTGGTGQFILINGIATGTTESTRIGNHIDAKWISCRWTFNQGDQAVASPLPDNVRMLIVVDHQSNGTTPVITDVLSGTSTLAALAHYNSDNVPSRFQIIHDEVIYENVKTLVYGGAGVYSNGSNYHFRELHLEGTQVCRYKGTTAAIGSIATAAIWQIFISSVSRGSVTTNIRCRYEDL